MSQAGKRVETHVNAVPDLVALCDEILNEQEEIESYRLLKFDKDGIHILSPDDFRYPVTSGLLKPIQECGVGVGVDRKPFLER